MDRNGTSFEAFAANRLREERESLTEEWVQRLSSQLGIRPRRVLPTQDLLDSVPPVLDMAADFVRAGDEEKLTAQRLVTDELKGIARLRRKQGYDVQEVIREFDELAQLLDAATLRWIDDFLGTPEPKAVARVTGRLNRAPMLMGEITVGIYQEEELNSRYSTARQLRDFTETLMHQIKTPLGAAEGAALLMENDEMATDPSERRRFAAIIRRNLTRARTVVDDVHSLALAQVAQAKAGRSRPLSQVLGEVLTEIRQLVEEGGVRVEVQEPIPGLTIDASRVEIILLNLISNAAKYADPGKSVRWVKVEFKRPPGSEEWWVHVSDNGLGISPEVHGRVFERFFRAHPDAAEGTGLGLAIVREATQQLGSRLEFESEPGIGSTFRFSLPPIPEEVPEV